MKTGHLVEMAKILREELFQLIQKRIRNNRVTALIGPRQVGKTTFAKEIGKLHRQESLHFFDLEDPTDARLLENPKLTLEPLEGLIIIDEVQRMPEIFPYLRVKADQMKATTKIVLLGSSSKHLMEKTSESLAGRISYVEIPGLSLQEAPQLDKLWLRGGLPPSFLARSDQASDQWRRDYFQAFISRDLPEMGIDLPAQSLRRFLEMLAGYHGQIFNSSEIGKSMGFSHTTARKYVDILVSTFLLRELKPWHQQIIQRQVKQPKIYFRDSGLVHHLLSVKNKNELWRHPRVGSLWEGFALEELIKSLRAEKEDLYFWALHQKGELDLLWTVSGKKIGFEVKYSDDPSITSSAKKALELLQLDHLYILAPVVKKANIDKNTTLLGLSHLKEILKK
jgi:predicted AAA+ superfamily ATPase